MPLASSTDEEKHGVSYAGRPGELDLTVHGPYVQLFDRTQGASKSPSRARCPKLNCPIGRDCFSITKPVLASKLRTRASGCLNVTEMKLSGVSLTGSCDMSWSV